MTQRLRTLAAKTDNLNLTPSAQMVEGENQLVKVVPDLQYSLWLIPSNTQMYTQCFKFKYYKCSLKLWCKFQFHQKYLNFLNFYIDSIPVLLTMFAFYIYIKKPVLFTLSCIFIFIPNFIARFNL